MDILRIWFEPDGDRVLERAKIYRNIDPGSIAVQHGYMYFAHPGCWSSELLSNRYRVPLNERSLIITDPHEIQKYAESNKETMNRRFYVTDVA